MMKTTLVVLALAAVALGTVIPRVTPIVAHAPLVYKVNLEDGPLKRWAPIVKDFAVPLKKFIDYFDTLPISPDFFEGVEWFAKNKYQHKEFVAEVDAIAQLSGYPFNHLFFLNFFYEFTTFDACTGIVMRNPAGQIIHGRNLDLEMWNLLANLTVNVEYHKNGQRLFTVDHVVGGVFAPTGIRHGAFAINADTRKAKHFYNDLIAIMEDNALPSCWIIRKTLEEQTNYADAIHRLKTDKIGGPVYYIVSGLQGNEGAVIERDTESVNGFYELTDTTWFLVQTNYDRTEPDPLHDPRRIPAEDRIKEKGQTFDEEALRKMVMTEWPNFNIATIMTVMMNPSTGYHNTSLWYGHNPVSTPSTAAYNLQQE